VQSYTFLYSVKKRFSFNNVSAFTIPNSQELFQNKRQQEHYLTVLNKNDKIARIILENKGLF
jgi:hypothetical protein